MIQGIFIPWVEPLTFHFNKGGINGENLAALIKLIIRKLRQVGIIVKAVITDQAKPNCSAMDLLRDFDKKSKDDHNHTFFVQDDEKIYLVPDGPHEWKCIKNN